jgi:hypothetical protein
MRWSRVTALAMVAVMISAAVAPAALAAGSFGGRPGRGGTGGRMGVGPQRFVSSPNRGFPGNRFGHHGFHHRFHNRFSSVGLPLVVYSAPPFYYSDLGYFDPPSYSPPPPVYSAPAYYSPPPVAAPPMNAIAVAPVPPAPSAPPAPTVVQFATGRYELRGDGMATPYAWVWVPNPPSSPPPSRSADGGRDDVSGYRSRLYRWIDEQGTLHLTDSLDEVPPQYRTPTKQAPIS